MRRILLGTVLAIGGLLAMSSVASADIGDIDTLTIDDGLGGTAEVAQVSGTITCNTTIDYGLVVGVAQDPADADAFFSNPDPPGQHTDSSVEGVGAYGPNQGNEANTPCSTNLQSYEVLVQRNRDSGVFETGPMAVVVDAGTSANDGDRGPGPFIGDLLQTVDEVGFQRVDP